MTPDGLDQNFYFGGGATESSVTFVALILLLLGLLLMFFLPRKRILLPFFLIGFLIPNSQVVVIPGAHLAVYRILLLAIWVRIFVSTKLTRRDPFEIQMNALDKVFLAWSICNAIMYTLLWREVGALVNRLGFLSISLGTYFMLRYVIRDREDIVYAIRSLAVTAIPISLAMCFEHFKDMNAISLVLGEGQRFADVRNGSVRAQGPFAHAIIAGTFGAILVPLFVALWQEGKGNRFLAATGILSSTLITITSASSTPVMTYAAGMGGLCFWPLRKSMRAVRWATVFLLILVQLFMKAPIWFLINRVGSLTGGTSWHRSELIDQFVRRFSEWCLIGTQNNAKWGLDMWDAINAYVKAGVEGGLLTFVLFLSILVVAYKCIGRARGIAEEKNSRNEFFIWMLGVALFSNTVAFLGIIYFDQSVVAWYFLLAVISVASGLSIQKEQAAISNAHQPISWRRSSLVSNGKESMTKRHKIQPG